MTGKDARVSNPIKYIDWVAPHLLEEKFYFGFKIPYLIPEFSLVHKSLRSACEHQEVVSENLFTEVLGPFPSPPLSNLIILQLLMTMNIFLAHP